MEDGVILSPEELKEAEQINVNRRKPQLPHEPQVEKLQSVQKSLIQKFSIQKSDNRIKPLSSGPAIPSNAQSNMQEHPSSKSSTQILHPPSTHFLPSNMGGRPYTHQTVGIESSNIAHAFALASGPSYFPQGSKPMLGAGVQIGESERDRGIDIEVDDIFQYGGFHLAENPIGHARIPPAFHTSAYDKLSKAMSKLDVIRAWPKELKMALIEELLRLISDRVDNVAEFQRRVSHVVSLMEYDNNSIKELLRAMAYELHTPQSLSPSTIINHHLDTRNGSVLAAEGAADEEMFVEMDIANALDEKSNHSSAQSQNSKKDVKDKNQAGVNGNEGVSDGINRKHSLPAEEHNSHKKAKVAGTKIDFASYGPMEQQFQDLIDKEASRVQEQGATGETTEEEREESPEL